MLGRVSTFYCSNSARMKVKLIMVQRHERYYLKLRVVKEGFQIAKPRSVKTRLSLSELTEVEIFSLIKRLLCL